MRSRVDSAFRLLDNQMHRLCLVNFFAQARPSQPDFPEQRLNTTMIAERPSDLDERGVLRSGQLVHDGLNLIECKRAHRLSPIAALHPERERKSRCGGVIREVDRQHTVPDQHDIGRHGAPYGRIHAGAPGPGS